MKWSIYIKWQKISNEDRSSAHHYDTFTIDIDGPISVFQIYKLGKKKKEQTERERNINEKIWLLQTSWRWGYRHPCNVQEKGLKKGWNEQMFK